MTGRLSVHRAGERFCYVGEGITSWHCFSAGANYDPDNVAFGPVVACDEHLLEPGAGFDVHPHSGVEQISWVLDGALEHADSAGRVSVLNRGQAQYQRAGSGIAHSERNASSTDPLRFVQLWLLDDNPDPDYRVAELPLSVDAGSFDVLRACADVAVEAPLLHLFVAAGQFQVGDESISAGDSIRAADQRVTISGFGELLVVKVDR